MVTPETSIWSYIEAQQDSFSNPQYSERADASAEMAAEKPAGGSGASAAAATAAAGGSEERAGGSPKGEAAGEGGQQNDSSTDAEETIMFHCEKVVFWQALFRGPLMEWSVMDESSGKSVQQSRASGQQRQCRVTRWEPTVENLQCLLAGNHPEQPTEQTHRRVSGRYRGRRSSSPKFQRNRTRRRSVVDTLRDESMAVTNAGSVGVTGGAGDFAVAPQRPNGCCSVQ